MIGISMCVCKELCNGYGSIDSWAEYRRITLCRHCHSAIEERAYMTKHGSGPTEQVGEWNWQHFADHNVYALGYLALKSGHLAEPMDWFIP